MLWVHHRVKMDGWKGAAVSLALTFVLAVLNYVLIEKPLVRIGRLLTQLRPSAGVINI